MCSLYSFVITCLIFSVTIGRNSAQESIGFPEQEENVNMVNKDNRQPVYIPAMCPENELYYPGDQKDDWICDCRPAYLYHPKSDTCWPAYRKGPCNDGQYLVLTQDSVIPVCVDNPCNGDGIVMYNGRCERLATTAACKQMWPMSAVLAVNSTTLTVACERLNVASRFAEMPKRKVNLVTCPPGCKRSINGKCIPVAALFH